MNRRYQPRAEAGILAQRLDACWRARYAANVESKLPYVGAQLAAHLESLYPAGDMATLARYGCTHELKDASVHVYNPTTERWDAYFSIPLPRPVLVPSSGSLIFCGGPWWSRDENRGVKPATKAEMIVAGTWDKFVADQDKRERERVPETLEPFFLSLVKEREQYRHDRRECCDWPAKYREETGKYPTWGQIEDQFPVLKRALTTEQWIAGAQ